jgi:hypothetical protein
MKLLLVIVASEFPCALPELAFFTEVDGLFEKLYWTLLP